MIDFNNSVSVIMPVLLLDYHLLAVTEMAVRNMRFYSYPYQTELILFHNRCDLYPDVKSLCGEKDQYIPLEKSAKVVWCLNEGIKRAKSKYVFILGNDMILGPKWFEYGKEILDTNKADFYAPYSHRNIEGYYPLLESAQKSNDYLWHFSFPDGCFSCMAYKKTWEKMGLFDENLSVFWDRDFEKRIKETKSRVGTHLLSSVTHLGQFTRYSNNYYDYAVLDQTGEVEYFTKKWGVVP